MEDTKKYMEEYLKLYGDNSQKEDESSSRDEELFDRVCKKLLEMLKDV